MPALFLIEGDSSDCSTSLADDEIAPLNCDLSEQFPDKFMVLVTMFITSFTT